MAGCWRCRSGKMVSRRSSWFNGGRIPTVNTIGILYRSQCFSAPCWSLCKLIRAGLPSERRHLCYEGGCWQWLHALATLCTFDPGICAGIFPTLLFHSEDHKAWVKTILFANRASSLPLGPGRRCGADRISIAYPLIDKERFAPWQFRRSSPVVM